MRFLLRQSDLIAVHYVSYIFFILHHVFRGSDEPRRDTSPRSDEPEPRLRRNGKHFRVAPTLEVAPGTTT